MGANKKLFGYYPTTPEFLPVKVDSTGKVVISNIPAHKTSHQKSGSDEISVLNLSGLLADSQTPLAHKTSHQKSGSDEINLDGLSFGNKHLYWRFIQTAVITMHAPRTCELRWKDIADMVIPPYTYDHGGAWYFNEDLWNTSFDGATNNSDVGWIVGNTGWIRCLFPFPGYEMKKFAAYTSYSGARGATWSIQYSDNGIDWTTVKSWNYEAAEYGWHETSW